MDNKRVVIRKSFVPPEKAPGRISSQNINLDRIEISKRIEKKYLLGFTLTEMMIVIGVIMIITVIAIPAMIRGKMTGNEAGAIAAVRTIGNACNLYLFQNSVFPPDLNTLAIASPPYLTSSLANSTQTNLKDGYYYTYALVGQTGFRVIGRPSRWQVTGSKCYAIDQTGRVLYCTTGVNCIPNLDI